MARCQTIRKKKRKYCAGDLRDSINIQDRSITPPVSGVDFTETFNADRIVPSAINTVSGKVFFDGVGDRKVTHSIGFRYDATITAESWILLEDGRRLDILDLENLDERGIWMRATCSDMGSKTAGQI